MKKCIICTFIILVHACSHGLDLYKNLDKPNNISHLVNTHDQGKEILLMIDNRIIKLDSIQLSKLDRKWIKKVDLIKDYDSNMPVCNVGKMLIHPKSKYKKRLLKIFKQNIIVAK